VLHFSQNGNDALDYVFICAHHKALHLLFIRVFSSNRKFTTIWSKDRPLILALYLLFATSAYTLDLLLGVLKDVLSCALLCNLGPPSTTEAFSVILGAPVCHPVIHHHLVRCNKHGWQRQVMYSQPSTAVHCKKLR